MKTVIVKNQAEWDALPEKFAEEIAVHVYSDPKVPLTIKQTPENSTVEASGNATVEAWGSATVEARENATVEARENATVEARENATVEARENATVEARENATVRASGNATVRAWGNATVEARDNSTVRAWGNATVEAWGSATVEARDNSTVRARGNSTVEAWGSATVEAWENATVEARENATVEARENAILRLLSAKVKAEAFHVVVIVCQDCKPTIKRHGTDVTVVRTKTFKHSIKSFCEIYGDGNKPLTLYKSVKEDGCDHWTGKIQYEGEVVCPDWDPNPERQCGGGLHLSPTPHDALRYREGKVLACEVARKDIVVYATDITKVRCRKVKVIGEWKGAAG